MNPWERDWSGAQTGVKPWERDWTGVRWTPRGFDQAAADEAMEVARPRPNAFTGFLVDMGRGFMDIGQGAKSLGLDIGARLGLAEPEDAEAYRRQLRGEIGAYEADRGALNVGRFTGNALATVAVPGGVAGGTLTRMGTAAASGAGIGAMFPTTGDDPWSERGFNALAGGAGGALGSAAISGAGKVVNAFRGRMGRESVQSLLDTEKRLRNALASPGKPAPEMPISVGDARGGAIIPKTETHLENLPIVGFSSVREKQNRVAKDWATRLIERIDNGTVDVGDAVAKSAQTKFGYLRGVASRAFDEIGEEADTYGPVALTHFQRAAQEHADRFKRIVQDNPHLQAVFGSKLDEMDRFATNTDLLYSDLRLLRDELSDMAEGYFPGGAVIGKRGAGPIVELRQAMEKDITDFMDQVGGDLKRRYVKAKQFYEKRVVPYKRESGTGLDKLLKDVDPDTVLRRWVMGDRADRAKRLWTALTHDGREAVKIGVLRDAFERATEGQKGTHGVFSHATFANTLDKYKKAIPTFFTKDEERMISGFQKILRHTVRAGQYMENPSTGARNALPMLIGGGVVAGGMTDPELTFQLGAGAYALTWLFGRKPGRNLLLAASKAEPGSREIRAIVNQVYRQVPRAAAIGAVQGREGQTRSPSTNPLLEP